MGEQQRFTVPKIAHGFIVSGLIAFAMPAWCEETITSAAYGQCMDRSGGVTSAMINCAGAEVQRQDKELNEIYQGLMAKASTLQKTKLREAQRRWLAHRDSACELVTVFGGGGSLDRVVANSCAVDVIARQVRFLKNLAADR